MTGVQHKEKFRTEVVIETYMVKKLAIFCGPANLHYTSCQDGHFIIPYTWGKKKKMKILLSFMNQRHDLSEALKSYSVKSFALFRHYLTKSSNTKKTLTVMHADFR